MRRQFLILALIFSMFIGCAIPANNNNVADIDKKQSVKNSKNWSNMFDSSEWSAINGVEISNQSKVVK